MPFLRLLTSTTIPLRTPRKEKRKPGTFFWQKQIYGYNCQCFSTFSPNFFQYLNDCVVSYFQYFDCINSSFQYFDYKISFFSTFIVSSALFSTSPLLLFSTFSLIIFPFLQFSNWTYDIKPRYSYKKPFQKLRKNCFHTELVNW